MMVFKNLKYMAPRFFIFGLILFSINVYSAEVDCSDLPNTLEIVDCHVKRYSQADKKLNKIYSAAMKNLQDNEIKALKQSQIAWLKYRDQNFALAIELNKDSGTYSNIAISNFKASVVEQRVSELIDLLRGPGEMPDWLN